MEYKMQTVWAYGLVPVYKNKRSGTWRTGNNRSKDPLKVIQFVIANQPDIYSHVAILNANSGFVRSMFFIAGEKIVEFSCDKEKKILKRLAEACRVELKEKNKESYCKCGQIKGFKYKYCYDCYKKNQ